MNNTARQIALSKLLAEVFPVSIWDDSVGCTAKRVLEYWKEFSPRPIAFKFTTFAATSDQMVIISDLDFESLCSHHLLPFSGTAYVGYIPAKLQVGLSKIPRLVDHWAHRPQVQERLTQQIANDLERRLKPVGVMVVLRARHTCMSCRGVRKYRGLMTTSVVLGAFRQEPEARTEFLALISKGM